jgi:hypothetical protein
MELMKPDGRLVSGLPCIYHLGLAVLYSEAVREDGESYIFDPAKTVCLLFGPPNAQGMQGVNFVKGFGPNIPLQPTFLRAGRAACFVSDCTDANVLALCKQAISGLVIAPAGAKLPPLPPSEVN